MRLDFSAENIRHYFSHGLFPPAVLLFYLMIDDSVKVRWKDVLLWPAIPLLYTATGLIRGHLTGVYPYQWSNPEILSFTVVFVLIAITSICALAIGCFLWWLDYHGVSAALCRKLRRSSRLRKNP